MKTVLFRRDFRRHFGGHLKVRDYYDHVAASPGFAARIFVAPDSAPDHLWKDCTGLVDEYDPTSADVLFIAGMDWQHLPRGDALELRKPVINLIQSVNHADPTHPLFASLDRLATRICVSREVAAAIKATGKVNGPVIVIPLGLSLPDLAPSSRAKETDTFIAGLKRPALATAVAAELRAHGLRVDLETSLVPRVSFLQRMALARVVVALPKEREGFFMPALEAMAFGSAVITLDAVGNRSFCINEETCLVVEPAPGPIAAAAVQLLNDPSVGVRLAHRAGNVVESHRIEAERRTFQRILSAFG